MERLRYPHDITEDLARRMAAAGCVALFLGIESLGDGVRVGKHHTKRPDEVVRAVDALHTNGIFVHGNFIVGLPGETAATVAQTLRGIEHAAFDSVGGGPFFLTPGSTFERRADRYGIEILDETWKLKQHINFYESGQDYFRTATLTQPQIRELAHDFRREIQDRHQACWNLSDYAAICWISVGGNLTDLKDLWRRPTSQTTGQQELVVDVLKEKVSVSAADQAAGFVEVARQVAHAMTGAAA